MFVETSFGSRASSSRWRSVVHAILKGPLLSDGCVGVAAEANFVLGHATLMAAVVLHRSLRSLRWVE